MFIWQVQNIRLRSQALDGQSLKSFRLHLHERTMVFIDSKEPELEIFALTHIVLQICSSAYLMDEAHKSQDVRKCKIWPKLFLLAYFSPSVSRNNEWAANWSTGRFLHYSSQNTTLPMIVNAITSLKYKRNLFKIWESIKIFWSQKLLECFGIIQNPLKSLELFGIILNLLESF